MSSSSYFRKQAETCRHLSRNCFDLSVAERLRELADEFCARAHELENGETSPAPQRVAATDLKG